jgi:hypothetical protein
MNIKKEKSEKSPFMISNPEITLYYVLSKNGFSFSNYFNWTMSYRRNSDIWIPYGRITFKGN